MSVAASRWAIDYLLGHPTPDDGGLSPDARAALLVLAAHAGYPRNGVGAHVSTVGAPTIAAVLGRHERTVRDYLNELEDRAVVPVIRRPGQARRWHFLITPMSTTPGVRARGEISTTPGANRVNPGRARPGKGEGDVHTSTYAVPRGDRLPVSVSMDRLVAEHDWDEYYAPVRNDGSPWRVE